MNRRVIPVAVLLSALSLTACAQKYPDQRPDPADRLFVSEAVEAKIAEVAPMLNNSKLRWMFMNCFPNTLDTTVHYDEATGLTFVYTGDIHAMWLRDSGAQVWPYVELSKADEHLRKMVAGVIRQQFTLINIDPYANAFNQGPAGDHGDDDVTGAPQDPNVFERKWEIDSHCYPVRLAYHYWKVTGDTSVFGDKWIKAITNTLQTFREQQRKDGPGPYYFERMTTRQTDTKSGNGFGNPVRPVGLIASAFRPSDDATIYEFLIPSNFFAVTSLRKAAEILETVDGNRKLARECRVLADEVSEALETYAVVNHPKYGKIYAFEVDGFGNAVMMDDANVPSLLAMAYLGDVTARDQVYQNTRRFVWSEDNPYFFKGTAAEGIGGPHIGQDMIWPMSIMMKAFTAGNRFRFFPGRPGGRMNGPIEDPEADAEIKWCIEPLLTTDAGTGFMHESFNKDNPEKFTREWFAWQNTLFGELILKLIADGKLDLLNSITVQ